MYLKILSNLHPAPLIRAHKLPPLLVIINLIREKTDTLVVLSYIYFFPIRLGSYLLARQIYKFLFAILKLGSHTLKKDAYLNSHLRMLTKQRPKQGRLVLARRTLGMVLKKAKADLSVCSMCAKVERPLKECALFSWRKIEIY